MILFPAIDIKNGCCVRLIQGKMAKATVFNQDPINQARLFESKGCKWIHVVDLDGAVKGEPVNQEIIKKVISSVNIKIQLGGGIRNISTIDKWFEIGVERLILGSLIVTNPNLVKDAIKKYPGRIVLGIDLIDDKLAIEGWVKKTDIGATDIAKNFDNLNIASVVCTNIKKDGAMKGIDLDFILNNTNIFKKPIIASGGITTLKDLQILKDNEKNGIEGAICGRAIYEGKIDPIDANKIFKID
ncbi:MAG: 1-(5-phosphoribosyl)-5-[(5-phosphoribosylamino)methylideneamino] imidazole-4-carboxamide isomerase [Alphaproteobacteria bacterium MarineAlpha6_Bin2]|nr:MAG: 1-(5-phosphoribosyl)-5-[(5-phosphoribosylamino)methylideneamino] imidazole-4-carboxamide isomerase [Alphaproteobacteria bacterium MarineAlpha6_Bin2]